MCCPIVFKPGFNRAVPPKKTCMLRRAQSNCTVCTGVQVLTCLVTPRVRFYFIASVKRYPRTILSTPGTSGYDISYKSVRRAVPHKPPRSGILILTEVMISSNMSLRRELPLDCVTTSADGRPAHARHAALKRAPRIFGSHTHGTAPSTKRTSTCRGTLGELGEQRKMIDGP